MNGAANRKVESQSMEDILTSIRQIIAEDQKATTAASEAPAQPVAAKPEPGETSIEDDILALRTALNAIRGEMGAVPAEVEVPAEPEPHVVVENKAEEPQEVLVSPEAGQAVRQSFAELAEATRNAQRPFDPEAAARDMLRPMLREWLDANLPGLVERLVREEIARIAGERQ